MLTLLVLTAIGAVAWYLDPAPGPPVRASASEAASDPEAEHEHTNHLIDETSPYLLQHAHNPVDWYPWGEEAFEKAKREDKPIFLSVGYSTCYWCHVMEKESFEDEQVAEILNEHYVAIKVDREERPDIDEQYMLATQLITRRGGWPNSVWLTPEGEPWMAGTYFPKQRFMPILEQLATAWEQRRDEIEQQADRMTEAISRVSAGPSSTADADVDLTREMIDEATEQLRGRYDQEHAGFGPAPKFPPHGTLRLLIERYRQSEAESLLEPITPTLDAMWLGGMHDHVGGGFHRYSTDQHWLLPHFEKMLYDNAQLMRLYTDGHLLTGRDRYRRAVEDIFTWLQRDMTGDHGAFYSAIDSGEVDKEGETYVGHIDEVREVLDEEDAELFIEVYNIEPRGNVAEEATGEKPGTNIPHLDKPLAEIAAERDREAGPFIERMAAMRETLLAERQTWPQPHKDDKVLAGWNGLMIGSLAYAGRQLDEPRYIDAAARAADFILQSMTRDDGTLLRTYRAGEAKQPGYLDDYAYFGRGLIELHRATGEDRWLAAAERLARRIIEDFQDEQAGGFYFTASGHEALLVRSKGLSGGGNVPNANGVAAEMLLDLADLTGEAEYAKVAQRALRTLAPNMARQPFSSESLLIAADQALRRGGTDATQSVAERRSDGTDEPTDVADARDNPSAKDASQAGTDATDEPRDALGDPAVTRRVDPVNIQVHAPDLTVQPGERFEVTVVLEIDEGWHLYGKNPEIDFLVPSDVSVTGPAGVKVGEVDRPEPHRMTDPILEKEVNTYTDAIRFRVPVTVTEDVETDSLVLELTVETQACDDSRCLPPETTELQLPLAVAR